jgi:hypothetical protein
MRRNRINMGFCVMAMLVLAGCHGGDTQSLSPNAGAAFDAEELRLENEQRMAPTTNPQTTSITGVIKTDGMTLTVPEGGGGAVSAVPAQIPNERIMVRLIDPDEDILSEVHPDIGGVFAMDITELVVDVELQVEFTVIEDLDGDGEGNEQIIQCVPLKLAPGRTTKVSLDLELVQDNSPAGGQQPYAGDLAPDVGSVLLVEVSVQDASGLSEDYYGVFFADGRTVYDEDGDDVLELGDDFAGVDGDLNGLVDPFEPPAEAVDVPALPVHLEGTVLSVNESQRILQLSTLDNLTLEISVPPNTGIEVYSASPGTFISQGELGDWMVGRYAFVDALETPTGYIAEWIVVDEALPPVNIPPPAS